MASADYHSGIPVLPATPPPRQKQRLMVLVGCCMLGARWVAPRRLWNDGGRHGWKMLLAAHFVSVLCVVLHFTWLSKDVNSYHINSNVYMNSYMQNKNSLPLTDHVNCASWRFFGFYFFSVRGTKTFFFAFARENSVTADGQKKYARSS